MKKQITRTAGLVPAFGRRMAADFPRTPVSTGKAKRFPHSAFRFSLWPALLGITALLGVRPAPAQVTASSIVPALTNNSTLGLITNATVTFSGTTNAVCDIYAGKGLGLYANFASDAATVSNVTFTFSLSPDGTNWSTTLEPSIVLPLNGTTAVKFMTNLPPALIDGAKQIRLKSIATPSITSLAVTNVWFIRRN